MPHPASNSPPSAERARLSRPSRASSGHQNRALRLNLDELEKLYAAHKQKPAAPKSRQAALTSPGRSSPEEFAADVGALDGDSEPSTTWRSEEGIGGRFYERYARRREEKLREEWGSKRAQKEATMKAMRESLEWSQVAMRALSRRFAYGQGVPLWPERSRSFSARSAIRNPEETLESIPSDEEDLHEQVLSSQLGDGSKKKLAAKISASSSSPRTPRTPIPRPSAKLTNSVPLKQRTQSEHHLAQDLRKENMNAPTGMGSQSKNFSRSKSTIESISMSKGEKPPRSQSIRKRSAGSGLKDGCSSMNSDGGRLTTLRISKEQNDQNVLNNIQKSAESKPFLRRGNGTGPGAGTAMAKLKAAKDAEVQTSIEEYQVSGYRREYSIDAASNGEEEFADGENWSLNQQSGKYSGPGPESFDVGKPVTRADDDAATLSSRSLDYAWNEEQASGESPASFISSTYHSVSLTQDASEIDAIVSSAAGSPVAQMRNKSGSGQAQILSANPSNQPRKHVARGFKRLLKFGRKSKGAENMETDTMSVSTASEADNDMGDGSHEGNRSLDDLRKSRMDCSIPAYDSLTECKIFPEQVQSLSSCFPTAPTNFQMREDNLSASSSKGEAKQSSGDRKEAKRTRVFHSN